MRESFVYKITAEGDTVQLIRFREVISDGQLTLFPESRTSCDAAAMISLLNATDIIRWDGFHGKHPRGVRDGIMFTFSASVNGGRTVRADGSANFPKGYRELVRTLNAMLAGSENAKNPPGKNEQ